MIVFRRDFLPLSETFVSDHIKSLRLFNPLAVCERKIASTHCESIDPFEIPGGRLRRALFVRAGVSPGLDRFARRHQAKLIHAHFLFDGLRIMRYARRAGLPLVVTAHGYDATLSRSALAGLDEGRALLAGEEELKASVEKFICVSDFIRDELLTRGYPPQKLLTIPLGVQTRELKTYRRPPGERRGVLTVGRLVEKKGTRYLIEAYAMLPEVIRNEHPLTIVGDGPLRAELEALSISTGAHATFLGSLAREEVIALMSKARVFGLSSIRAENGDSEGMPVVLMEAQALGLPLVIFKQRPMIDGVVEGVTGLVAQVADTGSYSAKLLLALSSDEVAAEAGVVGPKFIGDQYDLLLSIARLEVAYEGILIDKMPRNDVFY